MEELALEFNTTLPRCDNNTDPNISLSWNHKRNLHISAIHNAIYLGIILAQFLFGNKQEEQIASFASCNALPGAV